ncbi:MAG TPA: hypothetical protein GXX36_02105 [Clostridiaceae bacterium]|nr:hypothetical protein [Clostridiaceae bacterium]
MNYNEIERLKYTLINLARQGCELKIPAYGIKGRILGVGFNPYWTNPGDSKINKLEFSIIDKNGMIFPVKFNNIMEYKILKNDAERSEDSKNISMDIALYTPGARDKESSKKIRLEFE